MHSIFDSHKLLKRAKSKEAAKCGGLDNAKTFIYLLNKKAYISQCIKIWYTLKYDDTEMIFNSSGDLLIIHK